MATNTPQSHSKSRPVGVSPISDFVGSPPKFISRHFSVGQKKSFDSSSSTFIPFQQIPSRHCFCIFQPMGATALVNGINNLSIATDIQFPDVAPPYVFANGFSNTPSSIRSNSPSQMSSSTVGNPPPETQQVYITASRLVANRRFPP